VGHWGVTGTLTRYGRYTAYNATNYLLDQTFTSKWVLDLAVNYSLPSWTFTVGADDALDTYPDRVIHGSDNNGTLPYSVYAPFGYNGAYVYGKVAYRW
jgi:iron complex outermembrane receptor protein